MIFQVSSNKYSNNLFGKIVIHLILKTRVSINIKISVYEIFGVFEVLEYSNFQVKLFEFDYSNMSHIPSRLKNERAVRRNLMPHTNAHGVWYKRKFIHSTSCVLNGFLIEIQNDRDISRTKKINNENLRDIWCTSLFISNFHSNARDVTLIFFPVYPKNCEKKNEIKKKMKKS